MIGVRMGATSGVWALDPDAPEHRKPDGRQNWAKLQIEHGQCTQTHSTLTPGGILYLLFKWDANRPIENSIGLLKGLRIHVRGEGGYVIAPPSARFDGKRYEDAEPFDFFRFAEAPDWLYDLILAKPVTPSISERAIALVRPRDNTRPYAEAALRGECEAVASATSERNNTLNTAALKLRSLVGAGELGEGEVIGVLYDAATSCGYVATPGSRATMATINSGLQAGIKTSRTIPDQSRYEGRDAETGSPLPLASNVIFATPYAWRDPATIAKREWLYGYLLIRKFVSVTVSPGDIGKSSLIAAEALAMTAERDLLGVLPPRRLRVWLWNLEDSQEETERKGRRLRCIIDYHPTISGISSMWTAGEIHRS